MKLHKPPKGRRHCVHRCRHCGDEWAHVLRDHEHCTYAPDATCGTDGCPLSEKKIRRKAYITTGRAWKLVHAFFGNTTITVLKETRLELGVDLRKAIALYARRLHNWKRYKENNHGSM